MAALHHTLPDLTPPEGDRLACRGAHFASLVWFSLFHELGHLLKHGRKLVLVEGLDGLDDEREAEADRFAANTLLPREVMPRLRTLRREQDLRAAASELGVSAGVVVGRLQHEGWIPMSRFNGLKVRYRWAANRWDEARANFD